MSLPPKILITGASRGLGAETAVALSKLGARLVLTARNQAGLAQTAGRVEAALGRENLLVIPGDLSDPMFCQSLAGQTASWGSPGLDALVLNAGQVTPIGSVEDIDEESWTGALEVNLTAPFRLIHKLLPALKEAGGKLITVGTGAATQPIASWSAYCSAKAALLMLTRVVAAENPGLTAFSFTPGVVDTTMQQTIRERTSMMPSELGQYFVQLHQGGQLEPPEVPGRALAWCARYAPHEWSGQEIPYAHKELTEKVRATYQESSQL